MERIQNLKHSKETFFYSLSSMFERASYYGLRALVVLYMIGETLEMDRTEALTIYGWMTTAYIVFQIVGGLLGDLLVGNKKAILIGGVVQAIGAFTLCIPSTTGLYIGLSLVMLGSGLYRPNITANFGKLYLKKTKLLDSGFSIFYLSINLGAFLGMLVIGTMGEMYSYTIGFILAGMLMILAIASIILLKDQVVPNTFESTVSLGKNVLSILIAVFAVGVFWTLYELSNIRFFDLKIQVREIASLEISRSLWQSASSAITIPVSIFVVILWNYFYSSQFFKLMLGFVFGVVSLGILLLIPEIANEQHAVIYFISILFLGISEVYIGPVIHSVLTQYSNPKYLAIFISLAFLPSKFFAFMLTFFRDHLYDNPVLSAKISFIIMGILAVGLVGIVSLTKQREVSSYRPKE